MATEVMASTATTETDLGPSRRRFRLLDGMILVAATACGCAVDGWLNALVREEGMDAWDILGSLFGARRYPESAALALLLVQPVAAAWTLALIPLGLFRPRPGLRDLANRPGWVASCAFAVALAVASTALGGLMAVIGRNQSLAVLELSPLVPIAFAPAILAAWLSLALGGRWRPEPTWLDRSGRALGVLWVVAAVAGPIILGFAFF